ncbi:MAG: UDP-glucose/GDP-mannose dehydrogenase family protein [Alphaproteobacteria bacterium]|nr:UDP-glucose/GDP-mannose dehydrogenase family protein [Alphaproteobacteria bacterium]
MYMQLGFIGTGYVGLVTGVMCAHIGHQVVCLDKDGRKIEKLKMGDCIIYENNLAEYMNQQITKGNIVFSSDYQDLQACDVVFICVGTPSDENGGADLGFVKEALLQCAQHLPDSCLFVIKSTVPPTSCQNFQKFLQDKGFSHKIASNPEFLREGSAVDDFLNGARIVAGGDLHSINIIRNIYNPLIDRGVEFLGVDTTTSEMIKYSSNSFLAIKLSFINEMCDLCEELGADISLLAKGLGLDKRIGSLFLNPGPGYGGSCFPKDTKALSHIAKIHNIASHVLDAAIDSNLARYKLMRNKIRNIIKTPCIITALGVAFKAGTDDIRESPALKILQLLADDGYFIQIYDPVAGKDPANLGISRVKICDNIENASKDSNGLIILTEWQEFSGIEYEEIGKFMSQKRLIDLRLIADHSRAKNAGFDVYRVGAKEKL